MARPVRSATERAAQAKRLRSRPARGKILAAARELATAHGYERLRVAELAERAGVSRETFYTHFADKRACLAEATALRLGEIEQLLRISVEEGEEWAGSILSCVDEQIAHRFGSDQGPRAKILAATVELAAECGMGNTRLVDIIKAAHLSYPSFYRHFEGKEQCFNAACEWLVRGLEQRIEVASERRGDAENGKLEALAELLAEDAVTARVLLIEAGARGRRTREAPGKRSGRHGSAPAWGPGSAAPRPLAGLIASLLARRLGDATARDRAQLALLTGSILETMRSSILRGETARIPSRTQALLSLYLPDGARSPRPAHGDRRRLGGYRGGLDAKRSLLELEGVL